MKLDKVSFTASSLRGSSCRAEATGRSGDTDRKPATGKRQDPERQRCVQELKAQEQKVIAHEMAHKSAGGQYTGAVRYQYRSGPDGRSYIVGGEVSIDASEAGNPEETFRKMEQVKRAALAPAQPSGQDYSVASAATRLQQKAHYELTKANYDQERSGVSAKRIDMYV